MVLQSGQASVPSESQWLHCGQVWIGSGGAIGGMVSVTAVRRQPLIPVYLFPPWLLSGSALVGRVSPRRPYPDKENEQPDKSAS